MMTIINVITHAKIKLKPTKKTINIIYQYIDIFI